MVTTLQQQPFNNVKYTELKCFTAELVVMLTYYIQTHILKSDQFKCHQSHNDSLPMPISKKIPDRVDFCNTC